MAAVTTPGVTKLNTLRQRMGSLRVSCPGPGAGPNDLCGSLPTLNVQLGNTATDQVLQVSH